MHFVVLDFETLNPSRRSAFSICAMRFDNENLGDFESDRFVPSDTYISLWAKKTFGISKHDLMNFRPFTEIWERILLLLEDETFIVCHNAPFDISVLRNCLCDFSCKVNDFSYVCSLALARLVWPNLRRHGLADLSRHLDINFKHHVPESDCMAAGRVFLTELHMLGIDHNLSNEAVLQNLIQINTKLVKFFKRGATSNEF